MLVHTLAPSLLSPSLSLSYCIYVSTSEVWGSEYALVAAPRNREIGFVSSSFSFRVVRASGRGEAAWAREGGDLPLAGPSGCEFRRCCSCSSRAVFVNFLLTGVRVLSVFAPFLDRRGLDLAIPIAGFKVFT